MNRIVLAILIMAWSQLSLAQQPWQAFDFVVSDPGAFVAAINKYRASPSGSQEQSTLILKQYLGNGENQATHQLLQVYPSAQAMDETFTLRSQSTDWALYIREVRPVSTRLSSFAGQIIISAGAVDSPMAAALGRAELIYRMNVSDPAAYVTAFNSFWNDNLETETASYLSRVVAGGMTTTTHVNAIVWPTLEAAEANPTSSFDGIETFIRRVQDIRKIEGLYLTRVIAQWVPQ